MTTIYAKLIGGLVHLGVENATGRITSIAAIHADAFADLFGIENYGHIQRSDAVCFGVEKDAVGRTMAWEDKA